VTDERDDYQVRRSVDAILRSQSENGAIIASPDFDQYHFCWLRDGSFSAFALDLAREHDASARYHSWVNDAVTRIADVIDRAIAAHDRGATPDTLEMPPARFALDGTTVVDGWPNFQIDGYGTWLWSLGEHLDLAGRSGVTPAWLTSVDRVARYLSAYSMSACYDVWEENGNDQHTSTLACVYGGLVAAGRLLDTDAFLEPARRVRDHLVERAGHDGYFVKSSANDDVDASTLWLSAPFGVVDPRDPRFAATVGLIEERLTLEGGIRRYPKDIYFGSGAWPVLTGSLGWYKAGIGDFEGARRARQWIADHFDEAGQLGEQYGGDQRDYEHYQQWVVRWGHPARELTWSHAMYVVLCFAIDASREMSESPTMISRDGRA
jgi:GH15 family glucan-1,4-alpha-glucosidase